MAERKHEADCHGLLAFLHELARDVVDGGEVIGIHRMPQPEAVGQQRRAQQDRVAMKGDQGPAPCAEVQDQQHRVHIEDPGPRAIVGVV